VNVSERVLDVGREVGDLSLAAGALEVVVDPANENLFWRQHHEVVEGLSVLE